MPIYYGDLEVVKVYKGSTELAQVYHADEPLLGDAVEQEAHTLNSRWYDGKYIGRLGYSADDADLSGSSLTNRFVYSDPEIVGWFWETTGATPTYGINHRGGDILLADLNITEVYDPLQDVWHLMSNSSRSVNSAQNYTRWTWDVPAMPPWSNTVWNMSTRGITP